MLFVIATDVLKCDHIVFRHFLHKFNFLTGHLFYCQNKTIGTCILIVCSAKIEDYKLDLLPTTTKCNSMC